MAENVQDVLGRRRSEQRTALTGSEARAGDFDHYNSFTEYGLQQVLEYCG